MDVSENALKLIHEILKSNQAITIRNLALTLKLSEKTVWSTLNSQEFNDLLGNDIELIKKPNIGVYFNLLPEQKNSFRERLEIEKNKKTDIEALRVILKVLIDGTVDW